MTAIDPSQVRSVREHVSEAEWQLRVDLAAVYRLVALNGWDDLIFTHISARVPGTEEHFLINPYGLLFDEITASRLVKVDLACNKVLETPYPVSNGGFVLHATIHAARADALCVMHTHTDHGTAVAAQQEGLLPISQHALFPLASIAYHDYGGLVMGAEERAQLVAELGSAHHLVLRNHGLLTIGASPADAYLLMWDFERACRTQILAQSGASKLTRVRPEVCEAIWREDQGSGHAFGAELVWPRLLSKLDRMDPSYRS
jgi:ribulose-5-phosphate 4-epimerase/fuculose-1-phosphate aldolase